MQIDISDHLAKAVIQANLLMGDDASLSQTIEELCQFHIESATETPQAFVGSCLRCGADVKNEIVVADELFSEINLICRNCWEAFTGKTSMDRITSLNRLLEM